jgi:CHRD domain-containing protein
MMPKGPKSGQRALAYPGSQGSNGDPDSLEEDSVKRLVLVAGAITLVAAGAANARTEATKIRIAASMAAAEEVPTPKGDVGGASGTFTGTLTKTDSGGSLAWQLSFTGLSGNAIAAHIHVADRGKPGPVVVPLCAPCTSGASGTANITTTVLQAIEGDRAYVNVHTPTNPAGEIRGQLSPVSGVKVGLRASQERPKPKGNVRRARGTFTATFAKTGSTGVIVWRLSFSRLTGKAIAAHIHSGRRGIAGPVIVPLCAPCKSGASGRTTVSASVLTALESGGTYVNVHTRKNAAGEIRAQLPAVPLTLS